MNNKKKELRIMSGIKKKLRIPIKYQANLEQRFDADQAVLQEDIYVISIPCDICKESLPCSNCFFGEIKGSYRNPCISFIIDLVPKIKENYNLLIKEDCIKWRIEDNKSARELLKKIREEGEKWIEFY